MRERWGEDLLTSRIPWGDGGTLLTDRQSCTCRYSWVRDLGGFLGVTIDFSISYGCFSWSAWYIVIRMNAGKKRAELIARSQRRGAGTRAKALLRCGFL